MLIERIKISRLLSFGPNGLDVVLRPLNVLIGPNGSGKSNLIDVIRLLRYIPTRLESPVMISGGMDEWRWKGGPGGGTGPSIIECLIHNDQPGATMAIRHHLALESLRGRVQLAGERIEQEKPSQGGEEVWWYYAMKHGTGKLHDFSWMPDSQGFSEIMPDGGVRTLSSQVLDPTQSILAQMKDRARYQVFAYLQTAYQNIHIYQDWTFGRAAIMRQPQKPDGAPDRLDQQGANFITLYMSFDRTTQNRLITELQALYEDIVDIRVVPTAGGAMGLYLEERNGVEISSERLSDGTLRYLFLLSILLNPDPPRLIALEEPELGLHPDVIVRLASLLREASTRTQLVVTTHSRALIDALDDDPECVIVCSKEAGETNMERLRSDDLELWLKSYSLGELWSSGEIGGNRW